MIYYNAKALQIDSREKLFPLKSTPHLQGLIKFYLFFIIKYKSFCNYFELKDSAINSPSFKSTFDNTYPPKINKIIIDNIPKRGFPVTNPT